MEKVRHYFPGGNTPKGFYSFYDNILRKSSIGKLGIIKGGPGTGKSGLMKRIGSYFEEKGEYVHYLHCSSDCESLDGVYLPKYNSAVIDGTSPHTMDCRYAGAYDKIFDVGVLIDGKITDKKEEIVSTDIKIKESFLRTYDYLKAADSIYNIMERQSRKCADKISIDNFCYNISKRAVNEKDSGKIRKMFLSGITPQGLINYVDTVLSDKYVVKIESEVGDCASYILERIISYCENQNTDIDIYYCPMKPDKPEHIVFVNSHIAISISNKYHSVKNSDETVYFRDFLKAYSGDSDETLNYDSYIKKATDSLKEAKKLHDKLESFYISNFDFKGLDIFFENIKDFLIN